MFTTQEYIDKHKLGIKINDPQATRILHRHLTDKGYVKVRKKGRWYWTKSKTTDYNELKAKLESIQ